MCRIPVPDSNKAITLIYHCPSCCHESLFIRARKGENGCLNCLGEQALVRSEIFKIGESLVISRCGQDYFDTSPKNEHHVCKELVCTGSEAGDPDEVRLTL